MNITVTEIFHLTRKKYIYIHGRSRQKRSGKQLRKSFIQFREVLKEKKHLTARNTCTLKKDAFCTAVLCSALLRHALPCSALLHSTPLHSTPLHSTPLRCPLSAVRCLLSAVRCPQSTIHNPPHCTPLRLCSALPFCDLLYSTLVYATLRYASLRYATLRFSTLRYATPRYTTLRYATALHLYLPQRLRGL